MSAARRRRLPFRHVPAPLRAGEVPDQVSVDAFLVRDGALLLERRRPDARSYPGLFDVPGGRVERAESTEAALARELREELDVGVARCFLAATLDDRDPASGLFCRHFCYVVTRCRGIPRAAEGQRLEWCPLAKLASKEPLAPLVLWLVAELRARGLLADAKFDSARRARRARPIRGKRARRGRPKDRSE